MTEDEQIRADIAVIKDRLATCAVCRDAREQRHAASVELKAFLVRCCAAGDEDNSCTACIHADDEYGAACLDEIRTIGTHPHCAPAKRHLCDCRGCDRCGDYRTIAGSDCACTNLRPEMRAT